MTNDLIKLFESDNTFEIRKEIHKITDGLKLDLLVELNRVYYFEYLTNKLQKQVGKIPTESNKDFIKRLKDEGFDEVENFVEFYIYSLKNGLLEYSKTQLKIENVSIQSHWELKNESYIFEDILNEYLNEIYQKQNQQPEPETIDLSDTTATEKIIYLHKLGLIDFLRTKQPFNTSINSLATVLSAVTGANSRTIQSMLNAMLSKNVNDKNNPLNSQKPTNKVVKQLIQIGFESK